MANCKFYTVWKGVKPGVYDNWNDCLKQVLHFKGARYKSFGSRDEAESALKNGYTSYLKQASNPQAVNRLMTPEVKVAKPERFLTVDAACSGNPGRMEYRSVFMPSRQQVFHVGPLEDGTNNIGEFLAIVHALALLKQRGDTQLPIYSDSRNAILWVKKRKCRTLLKQNSRNAKIFELIERAEKWLNENDYTNEIRKWETAQWGEIPADFGRK